MANGENRDVVRCYSIDDSIPLVDYFPKIRALELWNPAPALRKPGQAAHGGEQSVDGCSGSAETGLFGGIG
jgi:hypothetical protein